MRREFFRDDVKEAAKEDVQEDDRAQEFKVRRHEVGLFGQPY
jgi:hypothetical protein